MVGAIALRALVIFHLLLLQIDGHGDVGHAPLGERGAARQRRHILHVSRAHHAFVVDRDVHEELVQRDVLLGGGANQVVKLQAGDGQHGLRVQFGVVEAIEKMDAAGSGSGDAGSQASSELGPGARHKGRRFLMAHLDEANLVLPLAQRFDDAVDAIAGYSEDRVDAPIEHGLHQNIRRVE